MRSSAGRATSVPIAALVFLTTGVGCSVPPEELVQPPLVYELGYLPSDRTDVFAPEVGVFFTTTRAPDAEDPTGFGNGTADVVRFGRASLRIAADTDGEGGLSEAQVRRATLDPEREETPVFVLERTETAGVIADFGAADASGERWRLHPGSGAVAADLRAAVEASEDRSLLVFVDGTKGNMYRSCALAAEARHLLGRTMPVVVFAWPSHQNIFQYVLKEDERRADNAGLPFAAAMDWLATHSGAERINVVSYSAGGRVASIGLSHLRDRHSELSGSSLREVLPLRTVLFAAADEPIDRFLTEVPRIHELADMIVVTISKRDHAVAISELLMGEGQRLGRERWNGPSEAEMQMLRDLPHVEFVDVSYGRERRGFKIRGHSYWYRQPWVVSDVIMAIRTGLSGEERGLDIEAIPHVWALTESYPESLRDAARPFFPEGTGGRPATLD